MCVSSRGIAAHSMALAMVLAIPMKGQPQSNAPVASAAILVTDQSGTKHALSGCTSTGVFSGSGTPFSTGLALDPEYKASISQLSTFVALNFHTPADQKRIIRVALDRGMREYGKSAGLSNVILMVPMSSVDVIALGEKRDAATDERTSSVKVAGRGAFDAGTVYGDIQCTEDLGPLGKAKFSGSADNLKDIRAGSEGKGFVADFSVFASSIVPFKASVTDTSGRLLTLDKAVFAREGTVERSRYPYVGSTGYGTVILSSELAMLRGETNSLSLSSAQLRRIQPIKVNGSTVYARGYDSKVTLRSGETFDLTISHPADGSGIFGATPYGLVWIPWHAVSVIEFPD